MRLRWRIAQFFEINWWRQYLGKRDTEAYLDWKKRYWSDFLEKTGLKVPPGASVLDAGCGPAGIFSILSEQDVDALDPLLYSYEKSLQHFRPADYPGVRFICAPLEHFLPEKRYDYVFCLNAINHVADLATCVDRLKELALPGGTLAVSVDAHRFTILKWLFRALPADILHPHQYDVQEYAGMFGQGNCRIERVVLLKREGIFDYYVLIARST